MKEKEKEYSVGQVFRTADGFNVICVEDDNDDDMNSCGLCFFAISRSRCPMCSSCLRSDGKNVIFKALVEPSKLKEEEPKTYFEVGEEFQMGLKRFRCIEYNVSSDLCHGCAFYDNNIRTMRDYLGYCCADDRPDRKNVIFVEVGKEE